jgi:hypothetical protein
VENVEGGGEHKAYSAHDEAQTKNKHWVVIQGGASHTEAFEALKKIASGCLSAQFTNGVYSLIKKEHQPALVVPEGFTTLSAGPPNSKITINKAPSLIKRFTEVPHVTNYGLFENSEEKLPDFEEVVDELLGLSEKDLQSWLGNAKIAAKGKKATSMQKAALASQAELKDRVKINEIGNQMLKKVGSQAFQFPSSFKSFVPKLKGLWFDVRTNTIKTMTLYECFFGSDMHLRNWVVIIGLNGRGKSQLVMALCSKLAETYESEIFCFGKHLDPLGCTTRCHAILGVGCFGFTDMNLVSLKDNVELDFEEKKGLAKVDEDATYKARYYPATLPAGVPRILAVNVGQLADGSPKYSAWFERQSLLGCAALANENLEELLKCSDDQQAVARNTVVFKVSDFLYDKAPEDAKKTDPIAQKFANRKFKNV